MQYSLVIRIAGLSRLQEAMGELATRLAVERLVSQLPDSIAAVLDHPSIKMSKQRPCFNNGQCHSNFEYHQDQGLLSDPDLIQQTLWAAEARLLAIAVSVFGYATARLAGLQIVLVSKEQALDQQALDQAFANRYQQACRLESLAERQLLDLLEGQGPRVFLQSIVDIRQASVQVIGYEALARGPAGSDIERADQLFETALRCGLLVELEKSCLRAALPWLDKLPDQQFLSVNSSAALLLEPDVQQWLARPGLWVELTEHLPIGQAQQLELSLAGLVAQDVRIVLDDAGCGYADLQAAQALRPTVVKLCITVIRALEQNDAVVEELRTTVQQLHDLGCKVLAEGVETAGQLEQVRQLGIDYAQGWHFGRPQPAHEVLGPLLL